MKKMMLAFFLFYVSFAHADNLSPIGKWRTIDDITLQEKSIVEISELKNHTLQGKVIKLFPAAMTHCTNCSGDKKNQPILGMVILTRLTQNPTLATLWEKGLIFNPKNGKTYSCNVRVIERGTQLQVRGYIGLPLFGRSQTWIRL